MSQPELSTTIAQGAPGCFGSPSCFAQDSKICTKCPAHQTCGVEVLNTLERIKSIVNVSDLIHKHKQALTKARQERKERFKGESAPAKPPRPMPKSVERTSKIEKITYEIDEETQSLIGTLPVKAQSFATQLCKTGLVQRIKKDLKQGENPLAKTGPKFLSLTLTSLINGGFTKSELRSKFIEEFNWTDNTAASHVSLAVKLLVMFEIAVESGSNIVVNPKLLDQNS